eukprot:scaffold3474_cov246-Pinguiococcus_pyrenoidosus.AAC.16
MGTSGLDWDVFSTVVPSRHGSYALMDRKGAMSQLDHATKSKGGLPVTEKQMMAVAWTSLAMLRPDWTMALVGSFWLVPPTMSFMESSWIRSR